MTGAGAAAFLLGLGLSQPAHATTQLQKITASDGASDDQFGYAVLLSQGDLFVSARGRSSNNGAVYVYPEGTSYDAPATILEPPAETTRNYFGTRILRQGDTLFVSAQRSSAAKLSAGAVFVYEKDASGAWNLTQTLTASVPGSNDWFGNALAVQNDRLLIGAPRRDVGGVRDVGSVYAFTRDAGGQWVESAVIEPDAQNAQGFFGASVAILDDRALVGMPGYDSPTLNNAGLAYAYSWSEAGAWTLAQTLEATTPSDRAAFGSSVSMAQGKAIVAAPSEANGGSVYVLQNQEESWVIAQRLESTEGFLGLQFGYSMSLSPNGEHLAVGAIGATEPSFDAGEIHLFDADSSGTFASSGPVLLTSDLAGRDGLGAAVHMTNDKVVVAGVRLDDDRGSSSGSVYIFGEPEAPPAPVAPLGLLVLGFGGMVALRKKAR